MTKRILYISAISLLAVTLYSLAGYSKTVCKNHNELREGIKSKKDTIPPADVLEVVTAAINSLNNFNIDAVANLYTPNAVVADDEPPYSWNGPTAGVQWVNAVEQVCKENRLTKLKGTIGAINVYQQTSDNVYIVVPVSYTGILPGKAKFEANGAFTFVLRMINNKWLIKSQVWMPRKAM